MSAANMNSNLQLQQWRQHVCPNGWHLPTRLNGVKTQKTTILKITTINPENISTIQGLVLVLP